MRVFELQSAVAREGVRVVGIMHSDWVRCTACAAMQLMRVPLLQPAACLIPQGRTSLRASSMAPSIWRLTAPLNTYSRAFSARGRWGVRFMWWGGRQQLDQVTRRHTLKNGRKPCAQGSVRPMFGTSLWHVTDVPTCRRPPANPWALDMLARHHQNPLRSHTPGRASRRWRHAP